MQQRRFIRTLQNAALTLGLGLVSAGAFAQAAAPAPAAAAIPRQQQLRGGLQGRQGGANGQLQAAGHVCCQWRATQAVSEGGQTL